MRSFRLALAALSLLAGSLAAAAPATAGEDRASGDVPVRLGPGDRFAVIDHLDDGEYYEVEDCTRQARWCLVSEYGDLLGWVRGSYLVGSGAKSAVTPFEFLADPPFFKFP